MNELIGLKNIWHCFKRKVATVFFNHKKKKGDPMSAKPPISIEKIKDGHEITLFINGDENEFPYRSDLCKIYKGEIALKTTDIQRSKNLLIHLKNVVVQLENDVAREELIEELNRRYELIPKSKDDDQ